MKKSLLLLIVAIFTLTTAFDASAWTDRNTFGLKGPVKNVSGTGELSFDKNGKYIKADYEGSICRDKKNRITDIHDEGGMGGKSFSYNSKGQVIKIIFSAPTSQNIEKYTYNSKGDITKVDCIGKWDSYTTTYSYQKFDKYGNWTKRTAKSKYGTSIETRTITYYK